MRSLAAFVRVPEAPMHKDNLAPRGKYEIGFAQEIFLVQPLAEGAGAFRPLDASLQ
jgi:hypothetical protein